MNDAAAVFVFFFFSCYLNLAKVKGKAPVNIVFVSLNLAKVKGEAPVNIVFVSLKQ